MVQHFKGDTLELNIEGAASYVFNQLQRDLKAWFDGAYNSAGLGEILYDNGLVPLTRAVARDIFVKNYGSILEKWEYVGSFESYIYVFTQIFGPSTEITFNRLSPGALEINITTKQTALFGWMTNKAAVQNDGATPLRLTSAQGNPIMLHSVVGIGNFYEVQSVLDSLNPAGIFLRVNFTLQGD